jgi:polyisoprenoid-binding protein YceI
MATPHPASLQHIDIGRSKMTVYVDKQGLFSFLADNHVIDAPIASGTYDAAGRSLTVTIDASKIRVLDPHLSADKRAKVQANMLGPQVLDVASYPTIRFDATQLNLDGRGPWTIAGNLQLHGQTHPATVTVRSDDAGHFTGSTTVRQSAFGITPIKIAGGAVSVKDDVRIEFDVVLAPRAF